MELLMARRKTINVAKMLYWANFQLARTDEVADQAYKQGGRYADYKKAFKSIKKFFFSSN